MNSVTNCSTQEIESKPPTIQCIGEDESDSPYIATDDDLPEIFWPGGIAAKYLALPDREVA